MSDISMAISADADTNDWIWKVSKPVSEVLYSTYCVWGHLK